tara:strand:+ start:206 stop:415 length:210 start_codon:yes stop_codon:yes gene_type:complete
MTPEECIDIIEALSLSFKQASSEGVSKQQKLKFKHILTQLELHMISMRKSVDIMLFVKATSPPTLSSEN